MTADDLTIESARDADLYEDAPCGFLVTAPDGTIRHANRTFLAWVGRESGELVGAWRFYDLLPPGAKIYYETHYAPLLQMQGAAREIALELVRADSSRLPVLVNATMKRDAAGLPHSVVISLFDASERRRYERELMQARTDAEQRAAAAIALEHINEGVVLVDDDARIQLLNSAAEQIFSVESAEAAGLPLAAICSDWDGVEGRIPVGKPNTQASAPVVIPLRLPKGQRWLAASAQAAPEGLVYTLRDVTEERRLEHLRDDIVAIVSHELRTPVAGIYGAAQTLVALGPRLDESKRHELIELIREQSERLTRIVEQVLLTQRLDKDNLSAERLVFDIGKTVTRTAAAARVRDPSRPIQLTVSGPIVAEGDPALFEQVVDNLLDNALKYSLPASEIRLDVRYAHATARVTVTNSGPAIPAEARGRIFDKFFRVDPGQTAGKAGTGLGLYIARELMTRMRGRLDLLDGDTDTTFFVELPRAQGR